MDQQPSNELLMRHSSGSSSGDDAPPHSVEATDSGENGKAAVWTRPNTWPDGNSLDDKFHIHEEGECPSQRPHSSLEKYDALDDRDVAIPEAQPQTPTPRSKTDSRLVGTPDSSGYGSAGSVSRENSMQDMGLSPTSPVRMLKYELHGPGEDGLYYSGDMNVGATDGEMYAKLAPMVQDWASRRRKSGFQIKNKQTGATLDEASKQPIIEDTEFTVSFD